jgi:hypothetical protein
MEVHHPHHPTHKKKWSEYIIEFLMLFAAVTLGFFAENVREHQIIEYKTDQNLQSIILDLKKDSLLIQERIKEYENASFYLDKLNDVFVEYQLNTLSKNEYLDRVSLISDSLTFGISFYINNSSYKNTIATGSLSVIASLPIKRLIAEYYEELSDKLSDNNRNLDDELNEYIRTDMQIGNSINSDVTKNFSKLTHQQVLEDHKKNPAFIAAITSPTFTIHTNKFEMRCDYYLYLMKRFQSVNSQLLAALEKADA